MSVVHGVRVSCFNHHQIELCVRVIKVVPNWLRARESGSSSSNTSFFRLFIAASFAFSSWNTLPLKSPSLGSDMPLKTLDYFAWPQADHNTRLVGLTRPAGFLVCNRSPSASITHSVFWDQGGSRLGGLPARRSHVFELPRCGCGFVARLGQMQNNRPLFTTAFGQRAKLSATSRRTLGVFKDMISFPWDVFWNVVCIWIVFQSKD